MKLNIGVVALCVVVSCTALFVNGCQSTVDDIASKTHGSKAGDGYTYGTGPNKTRPYPQSEQVNIRNVPGATPKYEALSRGGNKDYTVLGQNYMVWDDNDSYQEIGIASWYGPGFHGNKTSNGEVYNQKGYTAAHKNLPLPSYLKVTNLENKKSVIVRVNDRGPFHGSRIIDLSEGAAKAIDMTGKGTAQVKIEKIAVRGASNTTTQGTVGGALGNIGTAIEEIKTTGTVSKDTVSNVIGAIAGASGSNSNSNSGSQNTVSGTIHEIVSDYGQPILSNMISGKPYVQFFSSNNGQNAAQMQARMKKLTSYPVIVVAEEGFYRVRIGPVPENDLARILQYAKDHGYTDSFIKRAP